MEWLSSSATSSTKYHDSPYIRGIHTKIIEYFDTDKCTDVNFTCGNDERIFKCHRLIMAASSAFFDSMLNERLRDCSVEDIIVLHDVSSSVFEKILHFLYKGDVLSFTNELNDNNVQSLLDASKVYGLDVLQSQCTRYLKSQKRIQASQSSDNDASSSSSEKFRQTLAEKTEMSYNDYPNTTHIEVLYSKINEYFGVGKYTDLNISSQNKVFKCHRLILSAGSQYFERIFSGCVEEEFENSISLDDVDGLALEKILAFIYQGNIHVFADELDDQTVYSLLMAGKLFQLDPVQGKCILYLTEYNVPVRYALKIFQMACVEQKKSLMSSASRVILQHLVCFSKSSNFLEISFDELSTLLSYSQSSSLNEENALLAAIFQWVRHLKNADTEQKATFAKLTANLSFHYKTNEYVAEYFDKMITSGNTSSDTTALPDVWNLDFEEEKNKLALHVYFTTKLMYNWKCYIDEQSNLFTLKKSNSGGYEWHPTIVANPPIDIIRSVVLDDSVYCLKYSGFSEFTFEVHSSVDLSANMKSLASPNLGYGLNFGEEEYVAFSMCSDGSTIYVCSSTFRDRDLSFRAPKNHKLLTYNRTLDKWFPLACHKPNFKPNIVTQYNNRLYLIGNGAPANKEMRLYDHRSGKLEKLASYTLRHKAADECCFHKEKLYMTSIDADHHPKDKVWDRWADESPNGSITLESYDPVADRWITMEEQCHGGEFSRTIQCHRLISYDNLLWIFRTSTTGSIYVHSFNSFSHKLHTPRGNDALNFSFENIYSEDDLDEDYRDDFIDCYTSGNLRDVIVCKYL